MISAYIEQSNNMNGDIYAIRLDADGNSIWMEGTVTVTNSGTPKSDMMTGKGTNCLFITWSENGSIYAHCLRDDGTLGAPDVSSGPGDVLLVPSDHATIQDAINASDDSDTILVAPGTYQENINYSGKNIVIGSYFLSYGLEYFIEQTVIDGDSSGSVVTFEDGEDTTSVLIGFTIQNGLADHGGGISVYNTTVSLKNIIVKNNSATDQGGGIFITQSDNVIINNSRFIENSSNGGGGAIHYHQGSTGKIMNSLIENNICGYEGIIYLSGNSNVDLENCLVVNNIANAHGVFFSYGGRSKIMHSTFFNNTTGDPGAAIGLAYSDTVFVMNSIVYSNDPASFYMAPNEQWEPLIIDHTDAEGGESAVINGNISEVIWGTGNIDADPLFCGPGIGDYHLAENSPCVGTGENGASMGAFGVGCGAILLTDRGMIPLKILLHQNYPNPFNPLTTLRYDLPENALVNITIYDMMGRQVKTLINGQQSAGHTSLQWNATNNDGLPVPAGIYLYILQAGELKQTKKMVLLK